MKSTIPTPAALLLFTVMSFLAVSFSFAAPTTDPDNDPTQEAAAGDSWVINSGESWNENIATKQGLEINKGKATPTETQATFTSVLKRYDVKRSAKSIRFEQSPESVSYTHLTLPTICSV